MQVVLPQNNSSYSFSIWALDLIMIFFCVDQMDIHRSTDRKNTIWYSLLIKLQAHVEDDNDIITEDDIVKAISFNGDISGTTAVIVDAEDLFGKTSWKKTNFKIRTGAREKHELCWRKDSVEVTKSSNASVP